MLSPRSRAVYQLIVLLVVAAVLCLLFPPVFKFAEMAARELRYLWWLVLLVALAIWLIIGVGRRPK